MTGVMHGIMTGECTPAQVGGFLVGLRMKGETVEEIAAAAAVMRRLATQVEVDKSHLVDTCGTGGDASGTFNISTASALVAAGAGARVAKHGNRSVIRAFGKRRRAGGSRRQARPHPRADCALHRRSRRGIPVRAGPSRRDEARHRPAARDGGAHDLQRARPPHQPRRCAPPDHRGLRPRARRAARPGCSASWAANT